MLPAWARRIARHTDRGMSSAMDRAKLTSCEGWNPGDEPDGVRNS
jgi:hypothetical protein